MFNRLLFGEPWKSFNEAFYSRPPNGKMRSSYWSWFIQGFNNDPKIWLFISRLGVKNSINGVDAKIDYSNGNSFSTIAGCWYFSNNEIKDVFLENAITTVKPDQMTCKTSNGFEIKLEGDFPKYTLSITKNGKKILTCRSKVSELKMPYIKHEGLGNAKSVISPDGKSYCMMDEANVIIQFIKVMNLFTLSDCEFLGKKFDSVAYLEKVHSNGGFWPWRYAIFDFKDGSRFRSIATYKNPFKRPENYNATFDNIKTGKKYLFYKFDEYKYLDAGMKSPSDGMKESSKYVLLKASGKNVKIEILAEIIKNHIYRYGKWKLKADYNQFTLKLIKLKLYENGKLVKTPTAKSVGYGEFIRMSI